MSDAESPQELLYQMAQQISQINHLETLEIFQEDEDENIHFAEGTEKSKNIQDFKKYLNYKDNQSIDTKDLSCEYQGIKYNFIRATPLDDDNFSFFLISKDQSENAQKKGLIVVADASEVIVIVTCKLEVVQNINLNLISILYPN